MHLRSLGLVAALLLLGSASAEWVWGSRSSKSIKTTATPTAAPTKTPPGAPLSPFEEQLVDGLTGGDESIVAFTEEPDTLPVARVVKDAAVDSAKGERMGLGEGPR